MRVTSSAVSRATHSVSKLVHFEGRNKNKLNFYFTQENNRIVGFIAPAAHESHRVIAQTVKHLEQGD